MINDNVVLEDIANGGVRDVVTDLRKHTAEITLAPRRLLFRKSNGQINDRLSGSWPTSFLLFAIWIVLFFTTS